MKHKSEIIFLLFVITGTLFVSCNLEEEYTSEKNHQDKMSVYHKKFSELLKSSKFSKAYDKVLTKKNLASKTAMEEQYQFTIANNTANVIESDTETSYTLLIQRETTDPNSFENLVIISDSLNNTTAYIIKYSSNSTINTDNFNPINNSINTQITPIVYDPTIINETAKEVYYDCYDITYWVCNYPGHTSTGVCTHGHYETFTVCEESIGTDTGGEGIGDSSTSDGSSTNGGGVNDANNSNYDGSDPNIHGNLGTPINTAPVVVEEIADDPCTSLKKLLDPTKCNISPQLDLLGNMLNNAADNTVEQGFSFQINEFGNYVNPQIPNQGDGSIHPPFGMVGNNIVYGAVHSHIFGLIDMYSWNDVYTLINLYRNAPNQVRNDIVFMLLTPSGKCYALKIDNIVALRNFMMGQYNKLKNQRPDWTEKQILTQLNDDSVFTGDQDDLERKFLNFYKNAGISLYETVWNNNGNPPGYKKFTKISLPTNSSDPLNRTDCL